MRFFEYDLLYLLINVIIQLFFIKEIKMNKFKNMLLKINEAKIFKYLKKLSIMFFCLGRDFFLYCFQ